MEDSIESRTVSLGIKCFSCGRVGHISSHCRSKLKKETKRKSQINVNMVLSKNETEEGQRRKYFNVKINK